MAQKRPYHQQRTSFALLLLAAWFVSCGQEVKDANTDVSAGSLVRVTQPQQMNLTETIDLNANTIFLKKEIVRATFPGFIEKIYKNIGDEIHAGDLLLQIRTKESVVEDSLPQLPADARFPGSVKIQARSDGILTTLDYHSGDFVAEGEEIAIISNPSSLRISLNVPYQYVFQINQHSGCEIYLPDGRRLHGTLQRILPSVDPLSQTQIFLLRVQEPVTLPENLNVNARLPLRAIPNAWVVPLGAILSNETQDQFWIMKLINDSMAVRVDIHKGIENDSLAQVIDPVLDASDQIITDGAYGLPDTARVIKSR